MFYFINSSHNKLGTQINWKNMTSEQIEEFYKSYYKLVVLLSFKYNFLYTADLAVGSENIIDSTPKLIELSETGWEVIPAVKTDLELWISRYGTGLATCIFVGNPGDGIVFGNVQVDNPYLGNM